MDIKNKINQLLSEMTLKEKIGQLMLFGFGGMDEQGVPKTEFIEDQIERGLVGTIIQPLGDYSETIYNLQKIAVEKSRLKIPLLINADLLHGLDTIFPIPLAAACSFDVDFIISFRSVYFLM